MFFSIKNLIDSVAAPMEKPWEYQPKKKVPYPTNPSQKNDFFAWGSKGTTEHAYLSMYEGMSDGVRVTNGRDGNNPFQLHGLIVDYDAKRPADMLAQLKDHTPVALLPRWLVHTSSGNSRLIWMFERPLMLASDQLIRKFLATVSKELKLIKWSGGFDTDAFGDPTRYYEIGKQWEEIFKGAYIPAATLEAWLLKAADGIQFNKEQTLRYKIPFEDLSTEMHNRFPGRWDGDLYVGARGVRFWDPSADNTSAAVAFEEGMYCFTGNRPFVTWENIFGKGFVDKYEADYVAGAIENSAYDGKVYWLMDDDGSWSQWGKEDFAQELRVRGYDSMKPRGKTFSEIDKIENTIKKTHRVAKSLPFLYHPEGIIKYKGEKYMNTANVKVLPPAAPFYDVKPRSLADIKNDIPFLYDFFTKLFSSKRDPNEPQLVALHAWMAYFYRISRAGKPGPGQALVLAGNAGKGKTLFSRAILGGLMGGHVDASHHLVDGSQWTDLLAASPIMAIDDGTATADYQTHTKFTQRLKRYVANSSISYNAKWGATGDVPWYGRSVVTCNLDLESRRIIPDMGQSTRDKFMLLKTSPVAIKFGSWGEIDDLLKVELPKFARFLLDWEIPEERISPEARYYVKTFHDKSLFEDALYQSADGTTTEVLVGFLAQWFENHPNETVWSGSSALLFSDMSELFPGVMRTIKTRQLATCLGNLAKNGGELRATRKGKSRVWTIDRAFIEEHESEEHSE